MNRRQAHIALAFVLALAFAVLSTGCPASPAPSPATATAVPTLAATLPTAGATAPPAVATFAPLPTSPAPTPAAVPATPRPAMPTAPAVTPTAAASLLERTLEEAANAERPLRDLAALAVRLKGLPLAQATPAAATPPPALQVGRQDTFWVTNESTKSYFPMTATIAYVTPHAYFYVENGLRASPEALRQAADNFESKSYPTVRRYFGNESAGPNGDPRVTVLNGRVPNVGGYFSSDDQYPRSVSPRSNERNIVYINITAYPMGSQAYDATLAHEFQHLVSWTVDPQAETWFNEGSSELAMRLTGYSTGGAELALANDPNTQLNTWSQDDAKVGAHYAAGYLFLSYFLEHYGGYEALPDLLAQKGRGIDLFDSYLAKKGYNVRFDDIFRQWVVANLLDDRRAGDGRYWYQDIDLRARTMRLDAVPARRSISVEQYAAQYFDLPAGQGDVTIVVTGTTTTKLLANSPKSGQYQWWSHRGDIMDTTLTRDFDLTGLTKATLGFWAWFDIEEGYDYAYVEVSEDGGRTWRTLQGQHTTTDDPIGHNLGHGFTGTSGGGRSPQWVEESMDLSAYAGKKIAIRFEHVTDDAYNTPGFAFDDLTIAELGFRDDAETDNGWRAGGFVRTANVLPQRYSVQLVSVGDSTKVESIPLDASGHGRFTTQGLGGTYRRMVLVISPMTQVTTEPAPFEFSIAPKP